MNRILFVLILISFSRILIAQEEELQTIRINTAQYRNARTSQVIAPSGNKYLIERQQVAVTTDTLSLPFVDDFSRNNLPGYKWLETHITDTFYNVFGTCLGPEGIATQQVVVSQDTAWTYTFNSSTQQVDSVAVSATQYTYFGSGTTGCFTSVPQITWYWPTYYRYNFDVNTGQVLDSTLVDANAVTLNYAPVVYFATAESGKLWFDNYAYVNTHYPVLPPTIGVATLDGLNEFGLPYNNANVNTYGPADKLTSLPINLSGLSESDSVYLSFFYEAKGLGDFPNTRDSLIVEFRDNSGQWRLVWARKGYPSIDSVPNVFEQVLVKLPSLPVPYSYFYPSFQFRFRNKASLYGNRDHWHLDYVKLDKNRSEVDTVIRDIAFVYDHPNVLKYYTQMPSDQFDPTVDLADTVYFIIKNNDPLADSNPPATDYTRSVVETHPVSSVVQSSLLQTFNAGMFNEVLAFPASEYNISGLPTDSLELQSLVRIATSDVNSANDTVKRLVRISNTYAYDDGTSELSYGLTGLGVKKFGYEFDVQQPDTFVAFQIHYAETDENVSDLVFSYFLWDSLKMNDVTFTDVPIYAFENKRPTYIDSLNGFATFVLDTPIILQGKIYFGWSQTDTRSVQVGFDVNSPLGRNHMYVHTNGIWKPSTLTVTGSPMIRLVFDSDYYGRSSVSSVSNLLTEKSLLTVYPNPAQSYIAVASVDVNEADWYTVFDVMGKCVKQGKLENRILDISLLQKGYYLLNIRTSEGKTINGKFIKSE